MTTYALTGATGQLGTLVVAQLLDRGVTPSDLVAVVRDAAKATSLSDAGVQVRIADYDQRDALRTALTGVDRLLLISSPAVGQRAAQHANVIGAATDSGVGRIVYTSLLHADTNTMTLSAEHRVTEQLLADSGIPAVVLRNGWYVENYTGQLDTYQAVGAVVGATGEARVAPAPRSDYAAAAAVALLDDGADAALYELAGPAVTLPELAAVLSEVTGTELPYKDVSLDEYRAGLLSAGLDDGTAGFVTALEAGAANGELDGDPAVLEQLLGRPATDLRTAMTSLVGRSRAGLRSRADVTTATPERYAKQLVSHLGRKATFVTAGPTSTVQLGSATGQVIVGDGVITLLASGNDTADVELVEHVLGSHLARFGARDELAVSWERS